MTFDPGVDLYPGSPRILFIGLPHSTHTHAFIRLLEGQAFNVQLFGVHLNPMDWAWMLPMMPKDWQIRTYIPLPQPPDVRLDPAVYFPANQRYWLPERIRNKLRRHKLDYSHVLLHTIMEVWQPDIVHTLGLEPAAFFYYHVRPANHPSKWVAQVRGGPELTINHLLPEHAAQIQKVLEACDYVMCDNDLNYRIVQAMVGGAHKTPIGRIPGTGGMDVDALAALNPQSPSQRERVIVIPKAYEGFQSKVMPILEALKQVWSQIAPCKVELLAVTPEVELWMKTLPANIQACCELKTRVGRDEAIRSIARARVMVAPSLLDGVPNVLYEAMAAGTVPIVSPLETIPTIVCDRQHALFARNLYADEIAAALVSSMTDDVLVDAIAVNNHHLIRELADRQVMRRIVSNFYQTSIAAHTA